MNGNYGSGSVISRGAETVDAPETEPSAEFCSHCGSKVETNEWHPAVADDDGSGFRIHAFCDERCRAAWEE